MDCLRCCLPGRSEHWQNYYDNIYALISSWFNVNSVDNSGAVVIATALFLSFFGKTMVMKAKYYATVMSVVTDLTDLSENEILHARRTMEVVDARWLCVRLMRDIGLYPFQIAGFMAMNVRTVQYILMHFDDRMKFGDAMLQIYLQMAKDRLRKINENEPNNNGNASETDTS